MLRLLVIFVSIIIGCHSLNSEHCQISPKEKHCLIEYSVRDRWPHQIRYVYNWFTRSCFEIRWSENCDDPPRPPQTNNFATSAECMAECGGWA